MKARLNKTIIFFLILISAISCKFFEQNKTSNPVKLISEDEAKAIVIEDIKNDEIYSQYYILDSPNFDERVRSISWGKTILVRRIPNENNSPYFSGEGYYYILTGIMPDGQVLAAEIVDAQIGQILHGQIFMSATAAILRMATPAESIEYARTYIKGDLKCEAIFYYDGTPQTGHELLTWRYLVQPVNSDAIARAFTGTDYVLIDPYVQNFKNDNTLKVTNGALCHVGYLHRAFRFDLSKGDADKKLVPLD